MTDGPNLPALAAEFEALGVELLDLQTRLGRVHARLAHDPDRALEAELDELRARRDERLIAWASVGLRWRVAGGEVLLDAGAPDESVDDELPEDSVDLSMLEDVVLGPNWTQQLPATDHGFDVNAAQEAAVRLGEPKVLDGDDARLAEAAALDKELQRLATWTEYPRGIQRALVGLVACRLRYLQEESPSHVKAILERQIRKDFARLTQFSSDHQPGWVTGLSRQHRPETGSWLGDSEFWWKTLRRELGGFVLDAERAALNPEVALSALQELVDKAHPDPQLVRRAATRALNAGVTPEDPRIVRLLIGHLDSLSGDKGLKRLRRAVRAAESGDDDEDGESITGQDVIPPDWPYLERTRGHSAVMVGGEVRERRRALIQDALGFNALEWISGYDIRQVQNLAERISSGRVGFVILLARFISHKITDILLPACKASEVDWVMVKQGYGLSQIRVAIERYIEAPDDEDD